MRASEPRPAARSPPPPGHVRRSAAAQMSGCAVNTAAKRVRSTRARYSAQRTGLSLGSGRSRRCASPSRGGRAPRIGAADIIGDPARTIGERGVAQMRDQRPDRGVVQRTCLDTAADRQRDQQHRIAERIFLGACSVRAVSSRSSWASGPVRSNGASGTTAFCGGLCIAARYERPRLRTLNRTCPIASCTGGHPGNSILPRCPIDSIAFAPRPGTRRCRDSPLPRPRPPSGLGAGTCRIARSYCAGQGNGRRRPRRAPASGRPADRPRAYRRHAGPGQLPRDRRHRRQGHV